MDKRNRFMTFDLVRLLKPWWFNIACAIKVI
jgi:hypothetical protein